MGWIQTVPFVPTPQALNECHYELLSLHIYAWKHSNHSTGECWRIDPAHVLCLRDAILHPYHFKRVVKMSSVSADLLHGRRPAPFYAQLKWEWHHSNGDNLYWFYYTLIAFFACHLMSQVSDCSWILHVPQSVITVAHRQLRNWSRLQPMET